MLLSRIDVETDGLRGCELLFFSHVEDIHAQVLVTINNYAM